MDYPRAKPIHSAYFAIHKSISCRMTWQSMPSGSSWPRDNPRFEKKFIFLVVGIYKKNVDYKKSNPWIKMYLIFLIHGVEENNPWIKMIFKKSIHVLKCFNPDRNLDYDLL